MQNKRCEAEHNAGLTSVVLSCRRDRSPEIGPLKIGKVLYQFKDMCIVHEVYFEIFGIKFFICIRVIFIHRKELYFLSHVIFIFPKLKSYLFLMTIPCLTCFGCVRHMASI